MLRFRTLPRALIAAVFSSTSLTSTLVASTLLVAATGYAQNFIGPRYPGEVILSERIVTPKSQRAQSQPLPAPKQPNKRTTDENGRSVLVESSASLAEPTSLSDGGLRRAGLTRDDVPLLALAREVWERMLELERENAKLEATLEYERRLTTFREHSEDTIAAHLAEIERLENEIKTQRESAGRDLEESRAAVAESLRQVEARSVEIAKLQKQLRQSTEERQPKIVRATPQASDLAKQAPAAKPAVTETAAMEHRPGHPKVDQAQADAAKNSDKKSPDSKQAEPMHADAKQADNKKTDRKKVDDKKSERPKRVAEPQRNKTKAKAKDADTAQLEQPPIVLAVLPIGFQFDARSDEQLLQAAIALKTEVKQPPTAVETVGLQGGVIGPLGKNTEDR